MTSERIKEIQQQTAYPDSVSVQQALLQVWNECSQLPQQETFVSKGSAKTNNITHWVGVVKWNDGTILTTQPFYQYQDIKVWSSKFSYENTGKFQSIDYKRIDGSKDYTYTEAQKNEERVNNAKIISDATSSQTTSDKWKEYQDWLNEPPEISDEEIQKAIDAYFPKTDINSRWGWKLGCEWYREQLKQK
jgi:hypothetical protein